MINFVAKKKMLNLVCGRSVLCQVIDGNTLEDNDLKFRRIPFAKDVIRAA